METIEQFSEKLDSFFSGNTETSAERLARHEAEWGMPATEYLIANIDYDAGKSIDELYAILQEAHPGCFGENERMQLTTYANKAQRKQ